MSITYTFYRGRSRIWRGGFPCLEVTNVWTASGCAQQGQGAVPMVSPRSQEWQKWQKHAGTCLYNFFCWTIGCVCRHLRIALLHTARYEFHLLTYLLTYVHSRGTVHGKQLLNPLAYYYNKSHYLDMWNNHAHGLHRQLDKFKKMDPLFVKSKLSVTQS